MECERREINYGLHRFHRLEEKDIRLLMLHFCCE
jgi:hypothetical protein